MLSASLKPQATGTMEGLPAKHRSEMVRRSYWIIREVLHDFLKIKQLIGLNKPPVTARVWGFYQMVNGSKVGFQLLLLRTFSLILCALCPLLSSHFSKGEGNTKVRYISFTWTLLCRKTYITQTASLITPRM